MLAAVQDARQTARNRGVPRGAAGGSRVTRLVLTDFRNYRSARLDLDAEPGGADRAERRRQDQPARGDVVPVSRPRSAQCPAQRYRPPRRRRRAGRRRAGPSRRRSRRGTAPSGSAPAGTAIGGGERRAIRIDGEPVRGQSALGRAARRAVADAADGPAVCRGSGRPAPLYGPARPRRRSGACGAGRPLRAGDARTLAAAARGPERPGLAGRARRADGDRGGRGRGGAARRDRTARPCLRRSAEAPFRAPGSAWSARWRTGSTTMPALAAEDRLRAALAASPAERRASGGAAVGPHRSDLAVIHADKEYRRRGGLDRRAEGAADRDRAGAGASCSARSAASRRCCCSTRWRRISTRRAAPRCSRSLAGLDGQAWMTGTDAAPVRAAARRRPLSVGA